MIEIAKDVYQISLAPKNGLNCYVIEDVLIDAGTRLSAKTILASLNNYDIKAHALTHSHLDHQGGSKEILKKLSIPLWCGEYEKDLVENGQKVIGYRFPKFGFTELLNQKGTNPTCKVDSVLHEGDNVGGFKVIDTPGHTPGHISFFREDDGVAIIGDVLLNINMFNLKEGLHLPPLFTTVDQKQNLASIKKIIDLKPTTICFGHGNVLHDIAKLNDYIKIFEK